MFTRYGSLQSAARTLLRASFASLLCLSGLASATTFVTTPEKIGIGDLFLVSRAVTLKTCIDDKTCRLSLVAHDTPKPYLAFMVQKDVWEKFQPADKELYLKGSGHLLLKLNKRPISALKDSKYGGVGLALTDERIPAYEDNIRTGLRSVKFFVFNDSFGEGEPKFADISPDLLIPEPSMDYIWAKLPEVDSPPIAPSSELTLAPQ